MKTQNFYLLLLYVSVIALSACNKKNKENVEPPYPAVTQHGANVWACKINGQPFVYSGVPTFGDENGVMTSVYGSDSNITAILVFASLNASATNDTEQYITFEEDNPELNKKYYFNSDTCFFSYIDYNVIEGTNGYESYYQSGWVKFSQISRTIVAGEFEFKGIDKDKSDTTNITEGRFDISR